MILRQILITIIYITIIHGADFTIDEIENIPIGTYTAKNLTVDDNGKTLEQVYGKLVKVVIEKDYVYKREVILELINDSKYQHRVDRKLSELNPIKAIFTFENGYSANGVLYRVYFKVDANIFAKP